MRSPEFTFMDPAYGFILGAIFRLIGLNLFVVYLLQVLLDTATAYGILTIGRLRRPARGFSERSLRAHGHGGDDLHHASEGGVGDRVPHLVGRRRAHTHPVAALVDLVPFGCYCGLGVGLRSTLLLLGVAALFLPLWSDAQSGAPRGRHRDAQLDCLPRSSPAVRW